MFSRRVKNGIFVLEALNAVATTFYFYYLYFFTKHEFGFEARHNLLLAAVIGLVCAVAAIYGGRFAQRHGYFLTLKLGFIIMGISILLAGFVQNIWGHVVLAMIATVGMCGTWPTMQAMISEREPTHRLQSLIGVYNLTWSGAGAAAYFIGGAMIEQLGWRSIFFVPAAIHLLQLVYALFLERQSGADQKLPSKNEKHISEVPPRFEPQLGRNMFLRMGLMANPFAYLAINTVLPVIPTLAIQLNFSPTFTGIFCSIWLFVRAASFELLRLWPGWHYRFRWLVAAYIGMVGGFAVLLLSKTLWVLIVAQIVFGFSIGLIYYSSIFYSMDVGEKKGEGGGFHEAMIGLGSFGGPAIGAAALFLFPKQLEIGTWAVSALLIFGFAALILLRRKTAGRQK